MSIKRLRKWNKSIVKVYYIELEVTVGLENGLDVPEVFAPLHRPVLTAQRKQTELEAKVIRQ